MARLKFGDKPYYDADQIAGSLDPDDILNCYLDDSPEGLTIRRRPGLTLFCDLGTPTPGQGIFEWEAADKVLAVSAGRVFSVTSEGEAISITTDSLDRLNPVQFADGSRLDGSPFLYMANGRIVYSDDGGNTARPSGDSAPLTADSVVYLNLRFLANTPESNKFLFTDTNPTKGVLDPTYWESSDNPLTAESRGDDLIGLWTFLEEIYAWGSQGLEIWQDDGYTPFISIPQATANVGLEAKHSVVVANNTLFALGVIEGSRCVVQISGRTPQVISGAIANILSGYTTVSDAIGQLVSVGGVHIYLLQFPSERKTWAYNIQSGVWAPWGSWDTLTGRAGQFIGQHCTYVKKWNKHLIMSRVDGKIYEMTRNAYTDNGTLIKSYRRTVWEDHGSPTRKVSRRLRVKLKTGATLNGAAYIRWADDGAEEWSPYVELPMYPQGNRSFFSELTRLGSYYSRRYEISITDSSDLCVVWVDEDIQVLYE